MVINQNRRSKLRKAFYTGFMTPIEKSLNIKAINCWYIVYINQMSAVCVWSQWASESFNFTLIHICSSCGVTHICISRASSLVSSLCWSSRKQSKSVQRGWGVQVPLGRLKHRQFHCTRRPCASDKLRDSNVPMSVIMCWVCRSAAGPSTSQSSTLHLGKAMGV